MIYSKKIFFFYILFVFVSCGSNLFANKSIHKIEILVNDNIITSYDIAQHFAINSILDNVNITPENGDLLYNKTLNELIDMKLMQTKIDEYEIKLELEDNDFYEDYFFQSRGLNKTKVYQIIEENKLNIYALKEKISTSIAWEQLTNGLFLHTIFISETEINELLKNDENLTPELAERILTNKQVQLKSSKYLRDLKAEANIEKR